MALAVVLTFSKREEHRPMLKLPRGQQLDFTRLSENISRCITLSCCDEGIVSLLCSVFFEPGVPCNLIGPHFFGVRKAIEIVKNDLHHLAQLMVTLNPKVSVLWHVMIWRGQSTELLNTAMGGMPPISLPVTSWTGTLQSFIQASYLPASNRDTYVPRAWEFSIIYFINPNANVPFTPSAPFGETKTVNLNLDVREHLSHNHRVLDTENF